MNAKTIEFNQGWKDIQNGITKVKAILEGKEDRFTSDEYMILYSTIYTMCTQKTPANYAEPLYKKYKEAIEDYIYTTVLPTLRDLHDEFMLRELVKRWANHKVMVRSLSHFFDYLDRYYVSRKSVLPLYDTGVTIFLNTVYKELKNKVGNAVIKLVGQERNGDQIDRGFLKKAVDISLEMGMGERDLYEKDIEELLLKDTICYYSRKASDWIEKDSCMEYLFKVEECLGKEVDRVSHYLPSSTETILLKTVEYELLVVYSNRLLEKEHSGCRAMLRDDKVEDLSRMYRLFLKVPKGLEPAAIMFKQHIIDEGMLLVQEADDSSTNKAENEGGLMEQVFIGKIMKLHDKCITNIDRCFLNNSLFHKALKDAFDVFCNKTVASKSTAEILASFSDNILRKGGSEKLSDEAIEETLDKVVKFLTYINDKDLFAEFYRKKLSRRLLLDRSASEDFERLILTKLKQQCGGQFTSKMEGMLTDLVLAKENQNHYHEYLKRNPAANPGIDFGITILTTGFWPSYKSSDLCLPREMVICVEALKEFYQSRTKHRKLTWIYSLGTCNIIGKFEAKPIELIVGTYQGAVLLLFNSECRLSYSDIKTQLNLADDDLVRVLQSLTGPKYKILIKEPTTKIVTPSDTFEFNASFTDRMRRIRIPLPPALGDERKKTVEDVDKDRRYVIEATIVRIMKSRKVLRHQQLVMECIEQMSHMFKPDFKTIKKRIEELIAREYLERDKNNPMMYQYLA